MSDFSGKTIIVTGAGKGIGRACVELVTHRGARIIALSRSQADLDDLAVKFGATAISVDLADNAAARAAMKKAGLAEALINCAGTNVLESVIDMTEEGYEQVLGINLRAALRCAQGFAGSYRKGRRRRDRQCHFYRRTSWLRGSRGLRRFEGGAGRRDTCHGEGTRHLLNPGQCRAAYGYHDGACGEGVVRTLET